MTGTIVITINSITFFLEYIRLYNNIFIDSGTIRLVTDKE